jgi:ABC-type nitrate/sulfonate/bicarbonate transport system substrate-binding protein
VCEHGVVSETTLRVGTFTPSVVMELARRRGDFVRAGLTVDEMSVVSSPAQFRSLSHGELDVALTSPDNVLAYHFLSKNPLGQRLRLRVLNALDRGTGLSLWLAQKIASVEDVRGATLGVDVATSGFAFVAYALLERHGVARDSYEVSALGSTPLRARALIKGDCSATVLNAGNELRAQSAGCHFVASVSEIGPYLGTVIATMADLNAEWREASERFASVMVGVARDVVSGALDVETIAAAQSVLGITAVEAGRHLAVLKDPVTGLVSDGLVDAASIATLISLRQTYLATDELDTVLESLDDVVRGEALA